MSGSQRSTCPPLSLSPRPTELVPPSRQRRLARAIPHAAVFELIGDHAVILNDPARFAQVLIAASRSVTGAIAGQAVGGEPA